MRSGTVLKFVGWAYLSTLALWSLTGGNPGRSVLIALLLAGVVALLIIHICVEQLDKGLVQ